MIKKSFDIIFSLTGLLILLPFLVIIALIIVIDTKGPVFYKQKRVGLNAIDFNIVKFRTMHVNADKMGLLTVGNNDKRITRAGYWLRRLKIDELPQLLNVLKGDMSFVGPRPEVRKYVDLYTTEQLQVLSVKPGITDLASIKYIDENRLLATFQNHETGYIHEILPAKLQMNLEYIRDHSFLKDLKIILLTLKKIVKA